MRPDLGSEVGATPRTERGPQARLITVATFVTEPEAQLARSALEARGIQSFLLDDNVATIFPLATLVYRGVKVQVVEDLARDARQVIGLEECGDPLPEASEEPAMRRRSPALVLAMIAIFLVAGDPALSAGWWFGLAALFAWGNERRTRRREAAEIGGSRRQADGRRASSARVSW